MKMRRIFIKQVALSLSVLMVLLSLQGAVASVSITDTQSGHHAVIMPEHAKSNSHASNMHDNNYDSHDNSFDNNHAGMHASDNDSIKCIGGACSSYHCASCTIFPTMPSLLLISANSYDFPITAGVASHASGAQYRPPRV